MPAWSLSHPKISRTYCEGSLISFDEGGKTALLFSNPADNRPKGRTHLTVRLSRDDGKTWAQSAVLHAGFSAYSCLAVLPAGGGIGCLYERSVGLPVGMRRSRSRVSRWPGWRVRRRRDRCRRCPSLPSPTRCCRLASAAASDRRRRRRHQPVRVGRFRAGNVCSICARRLSYCAGSFRLAPS